MFLCFRTRKLHQSTCSRVFSPFSAHFYPPLHHNGKGSIVVLSRLEEIMLFFLPIISYPLLRSQPVPIMLKLSSILVVKGLS